MNLADLSTRLLSAITAHLHYLDVENLWLSGSSELNNKFSNGGVSQLTIIFSSSIHRFSWPGLLYRLQLSRLSIEDWNTDSKIRPISPDLLATWSLVSDLTLHCPGAFSALQSLLKVDTGSFSVLRVLTISILEGESHEEHETVLWPQNLSTLILKTFSDRHLALDLSSLPPRLTTLDGLFSKIVNPQNGTFPASITMLHLGLDSLSCDPVPLLPIGLKDLCLYPSIKFCENGQEDFDSWAQRSIRSFPRTLTSLELEVQENFNRDDLKALAETLPNLTELNV